MEEIKKALKKRNKSTRNGAFFRGGCRLEIFFFRTRKNAPVKYWLGRL